LHALLLTAIKQKVNTNSKRQGFCCFAFYKITSPTEVGYFSKNCKLKLSLRLTN
jgi:hypothetical protein